MGLGKFGIAVALASTTLSSLAMAQAPAPEAVARSLEEQFRNPPSNARPRVWWHWVDGNVTKDGIEKDLAWMKRIGVAGFQNFDAARDGQQIVDHRIVYMSPEWRDMFRFAVTRADALGLEYGIAASPGWSETGGPWVKPEDAMKKLVWSATTVFGGKRFDGRLATPPAVPGPYQGLARAPDHGYQAPDFYRDAVVVAFREDAEAPTPAATVSANGKPIDGATLTDGDDTTGIPLPGSTAEGPGFVAISYAKPRTVRSLRMVVTNPPNSAIAGPLSPRLEASADGTSWREVAAIPLTNVPTTASFAPITAQHFRIVFRQGPRADRSSFAPAPGVDIRAAFGVGGGGSGAPAAPKVVTLTLSAQPRINAAELKAGFAIADDYYALDGSAPDDAPGVPPASVVDLTDAISADGRLQWTPPKGRWTVLRMGYSLTGKTNAPATKESTGLEVDKYDASAVARYLVTYLDGYRRTTGDALFGKRGLTTLVTDSTEVGPSNWTPDMLAQFQRLRGYDARPWLPALTGAIVGSRRQSDAFLYDFRRTLADLTTSEHYGTIAKVAKAQGLTVYGESLEGGRTISSLGDDLDMRRYADVPMGAMWAYGRKPASNLIADMRGAASVAHVYGKRYVAAESLTSILNPWAHAPGDLQPMIDAEFLSGINRPFLHSVVHQPHDDRQPGLSLQAFGQYFNRHETWAEMARPWIDYIARSSLLLQQGRNVADVAYFYGEEAPIGTQALAGYPADVPQRYAYDFVSAEMLLNALTAQGGALVSKGGANYRAVELGGTSSRMTVPVLRKLSALADAGIAIVGKAPISSPALTDDPAEFAALVKRLWGEGGRAEDLPIEAALAKAGVTPDFAFTGTIDSDIQFVHRATDEGEIYFVSNRKLRPEPIEARFRITGKVPELWHADDGRTQPVSYRLENGETVVPLNLAAGESVFVLFRKPAASSLLTVAKAQLAPIAAIDGAWDVAFQEGRGAPARATLDALGSLSAQAEPGIKYFSGIATYRKQITLPRVARGAELILDLGKVGDVAEVLINGRPAGIAWKAPYRVEIGSLVRPGKNTLEIRVANLWVNRLIGDQQPNATKVTFTTTPTYTAKAPLRPSGLIGPVRILQPISGSTAAGAEIAR